MADMDDDELLAALGVVVEPEKAASRTPREERIIAGFEDILCFHQTHGRAPQHGKDRDIFERLYAVRLEQLRKLPEARILLAALDAPGLLAGAAMPVEIEDDDALLSELGASVDEEDGDDITVLRHVRSHAEIRTAEEIADRMVCEDFDTFKPLFENVEIGLRQGQWITNPLARTPALRLGISLCWVDSSPTWPRSAIHTRHRTPKPMDDYA